MSSWNVYRRWATNTTTRHAFYQTFWIVATDMGREVGQGLGITHYGKLTPEISGSRRAVHGGQVKLQRCDHSEVTNKFAEKTRGDYVASKQQQDSFSESGLRKWLQDEFGAAKRDEILLGLALKAGTALGEIPHPIVMGDDSSVPDDGGAAELEELLRMSDERSGRW